MTTSRWLGQRWLFAYGCVLCAALIATALFMQYVGGLEPCPLCILQRVAVIGTGLVLLVAAIHDPGATGRRVYGVLVLVTAGFGAGVAGRHLWLQSLPPDQVPECGPGLAYMLRSFPLHEVLDMVLKGSGECAQVNLRFLGLTIPGWTLIAFSGFILFALWMIVRRGSPSRDS